MMQTSMKILCLNMWGGKMRKELLAYLRRQSKTVDVFCFQEVLNTDSTEYASVLLNEFEELFPDFQITFVTIQEGHDIFSGQPAEYPFSWGLAILVKKGISFTSGSYFIHRKKNALFENVPLKMRKGRSIYDPIFVRARKKYFTPEIFQESPEAAQYVIFKKGKNEYTVCNLHGLWYPGTKVDTPQRIAQSKKILKGLSELPGKKILCGDFNLFPETKSICLFEKSGLRNLIKEFHIKDTRGPVDHKIHFDSLQMFADYMFVSPNVKVKSFKVPQVSISDHLPLILEIS